MEVERPLVLLKCSLILDEQLLTRIANTARGRKLVNANHHYQELLKKPFCRQENGVPENLASYSSHESMQVSDNPTLQPSGVRLSKQARAIPQHRLHLRVLRLRQSDRIRLLELHPSPDLNARTEFSFICRRLSACDEDLVNHYIALSYIWGDASQRSTSLVEGLSCHMTVNPNIASRYMRDPTRKRLI
ncbi:hypothetical protein BDZ45DRAFT_800981 [Acephala macrosclerotiorum]|nr:hypothetical protein BDZ45DRAFT_800981 [Acephala macrosclerotiorum]